MAVGWKSFGIVGAASVVSVGTLYSVLVREPATTAPPEPVTSAAPGSQPAAPTPGKPPAASQPQQNVQAPTAPQSQASAQPQAPKPNAPSPVAAKPAAQPEAAKPAAGTTAAPAAGAKPADTTPAAKEQVLPTFDIARIEPGGDAVIAGRAAPGATVELLRNGNTYARAVADVGGQWAIVPPALPKGPCELTLRTTSPDGRVTQSEQTVSVRVPEQPGEEVVIVLNTPNEPSKVLTDAVPPTGKAIANSQVAAAPPTQGLPAGNGPTVTNPSSPTPSTPKDGAGNTPSRANASIRTVEADENGRFFVTGMAEPGASLRIYLNDTLVTTVTAARDGTFGMTIEKGMSQGDYKVRVDDVAAGTGQVLTRAEVPFAMAEKTAAGSAPAVVAAASTPGKSAAPGAAVPVSASSSLATRGVSGSATPQQAQPASVQAPGTAPSPGVPAASGQPGQGASPAAGVSEGGNPVLPTATMPAAATQAAPGNQPVRVGDAGPTGTTPPPSMAVIPEIRTTTIVQGDNLWRISRKIYGQGIRYTWIYDANTNQIRNPNRIYPGQIFVMPEKKVP
ncbi:LysM peptidoglycan-binding domain-containing protein [Labrys okinawensis]|uniref:LysM peptidoglycan-binding domain-containing protein n=1 Tax=Labrys okinawensis TaxID=346911 RepID=UPI0039BD0C58